MGFTLAGDDAWDSAFLEGLDRALRHFGAPLLGGDTVSGAGRRVLGLTAIGQAPAGLAPSRIQCLLHPIHAPGIGRSEEHTSELQSLMRISYAVFCLKKKKIHSSIFFLPCYKLMLIDDLSYF